MINRYSRKQMEDIWKQENRFAAWLKIELAVCEAWTRRGVIPDDSMARIREKGSFNVDRINEIEKTTRHDVIAFTTSVAEFVGEDSRFVHRGLTSYDVVDTALSLLMKEAGVLIRKGIRRTYGSLKRPCIRDKESSCGGKITWNPCGTHNIRIETGHILFGNVSQSQTLGCGS